MPGDAQRLVYNPIDSGNPVSFMRNSFAASSYSPTVDLRASLPIGTVKTKKTPTLL